MPRVPSKQDKFPGYQGKMRWSVNHPKFGTTQVTAPDEDTAMFTAAAVWNTAWITPDFYLYCEVARL